MRIERRDTIVRLLQQMQVRAKQGGQGPLGQSIAQIMRRGRGSVEEQFQRQALDSAITGKRAWAPVGDFGTRKAPSSALRRTGRLFSAWMGGRGSITRASANAVEVGVSGGEVPYAVPQHEGALVRAKRSTVATNRLTMQEYLGYAYGVWIGAKRLLQGLRIPARPVGVSTQVLSRAGLEISNFLLTGRAAAR